MIDWQDINLWAGVNRLIADLRAFHKKCWDVMYENAYHADDRRTTERRMNLPPGFHAMAQVFARHPGIDARDVEIVEGPMGVLSVRAYAPAPERRKG